MNSLPVGGMITRIACGSTTRRILAHVPHAQRVGGLALAVGHRLDAGPEDLGHIRAVVEPEGDGACGGGLEDQRLLEVGAEARVAVDEVAADLRQRQVDEEHLHDQRSAPEERHVEAGDAVQDRVVRQPGQGTQRRQDRRQHDAAERHQQRELQPAEDEGEVLPHPLDVIVGEVEQPPEQGEQHGPDRTAFTWNGTRAEARAICSPKSPRCRHC